MSTIIVFAETANGKVKKISFEAISFAADLAQKNGGTVKAVALNADENLEVLGSYGANQVVNKISEDLKEFNPQAYAKALTSEEGSVYILPNSIEGSTMAPFVSLNVDASLITNVIGGVLEATPVTVNRKSFSGKGIMKAKSAKEKIVLTLSQNSFGVLEGGAMAETVTAEFSVDASDVKTKVESIEKSEGKIDLKEADIVVSAGRGLKGPENWEMIEELADVLGAATACSKPVSDIGWRPHSEHVGQTGKAVAPNLYIAIGISGAIQHLAGINASKTIVVVNTDAEAPFFKAADYGIVGDAFEVIPELITKIKALKA